MSHHANQWRISGDFWDEWGKLDRQFDLFDGWSRSNAVGPGHFADGDMIPFGRVAIRSAMGGIDHISRFTADERRTLLSLWALEASPLILGGNLPDLDAASLADLQNQALIAIDQDTFGAPAITMLAMDGVEAWVKTLSGHRTAVGLFNRTSKAAVATAPWRDLGIDRPGSLMDIWSHRQVEVDASGLASNLPPHGVALFVVSQ